MRKYFLLFLLLATSGLIVVVAHPQGRPIPPGVREADTQINKPLEAPLSAKRRPVDAAQLQREADELAKLAAAIAGQVGHVTQGQFPKDLGDQLKRIEKLAKHLRKEISQ